MEHMNIPFEGGKLAIIGDLHIDKFKMHETDPLAFSGLDKLILESDALIIAGDLVDGYGSNLKAAITHLSQYIDVRRIFFIPGNHEYYRSKLSDGELEEVVCRTGANFAQKKVLLHGDTRIACCTLWTDFDLSGRQEDDMKAASKGLLDYRCIRTNNDFKDELITPKHTLEVHEDHKAWLEEALAERHPHGEDGRTVVVTHHGPHPCVAGVIDSLTSGFCTDLSKLIARFQPESWFFGHTHRNIRAVFAATDIRNVSTGYHYELEKCSSTFLQDACKWESYDIVHKK